MFNVKDFWFHLKTDWTAWRNGQKRIAPWGSTGRTHIPRGANIYTHDLHPATVRQDEGGVYNSQAHLSMTMDMKITRADGTVEEIRGIPVKAAKNG